jgi:acetyl esterase/lipase
VRWRAEPILSALAAIVLAAGGLAACGSTSHGSTTARPRLAAVWGMPTNGRPRAVVLLIHGGGWAGQNATYLADAANDGRNLQRLGYETLAFDYRAGALGIEDAQAFYREARERVGPHLPICALGWSAGAHIALMLAVMDPGLACVVDLAGPTDLTVLAVERGGAYGSGIAARVFGTRRLAAYSPALRAHSIRAKALLMYARDDPVVPVAQGEIMARALPGSRLIVLPPGPEPFVHSGVAPAAYQRALITLGAFLNHVARSR